ncbi:hypothetical protein Cni_G10190 [Canna indica]|uniref:Reverse transcriptase domain-containing protein n=1 Tax=Canna indica TaxID=4628 RepID=A0AAQ3K5C8_9LILI|nr:hypothetical protein Cni_G10190 [Canna indica]
MLTRSAHIVDWASRVHFSSLYLGFFLSLGWIGPHSPEKASFLNWALRLCLLGRVWAGRKLKLQEARLSTLVRRSSCIAHKSTKYPLESASKRKAARNEGLIVPQAAPDTTAHPSSIMGSIIVKTRSALQTALLQDIEALGFIPRVITNVYEPMIVGGDFNITLHNHERINCIGNPTDSRRFSKVVADTELMDFPFSRSPFTWSNNQQPPALAKLDRILSNSSWALLFPMSLANSGERKLSNHKPLVWISSNNSSSSRVGPFRIEAGWLACEQFTDIVKAELEIGNPSSWAGLSPLSKWMKLWKPLWHTILLWNKFRRASRAKHRVETEDRLNSLCTKADLSSIADFEVHGRVEHDQTTIASSLRDFYIGLLGREIKPLLNIKWDSLYGSPSVDISSLDNPFTMTKRQFGVVRGLTPDVCLIKVDFEKAFNSVNWDFIIQLLRARGFAPRWISWIQFLLQSAESSLVINGVEGRLFKHKRGLRQGNPISPLLFNLVTDVLSRLVTKATTVKIVSGALNNILEGGITHILFVDDLLMFTSASEESLKNFALLLKCFDICTGLKMNTLKTKTGKHDIDLRGKCYVGWDSLTRPLSEGGLGILNLHSHNLARLGKSIWNLLQPGGLQWKDILSALYPRLCLLSSASRQTLSSVWKGICSLLDIFGVSLSFRPGEVSSFRFWLDPWVCGNRLCRKYPSLFSDTMNLNISIEMAKQQYASNEVLGWSLQFRYLVHNDLLDRLVTDIAPFLHGTSNDSIGWKWTKEGAFTTSSLYRLLNFKGISEPWTSYIWQVNFPPAISLTNWLIEKRRLPTRDRLLKHNVQLPSSSCVLCTNIDESHSHLFKDCPFTIAGWRMFPSLLDTPFYALDSRPWETNRNGATNYNKKQY